MKSTRILLVIALLGAFATGALATSGCSKKDVAAKVNGESISTTQVNEQLDQLKKQYPNMFTGADGEGRLLDFKQRIVDNLINAKLVEQAAKEKGITVSDADIQKQVDQLKGGFKDQTQFEAALKSAGMTLDSLKTSIRRPARDQQAHGAARGQRQGHRAGHPGVLRQQQGAVRAEGAEARLARAVQGQRQGDRGRRSSSSSRPARSRSPRPPRSTRSTPRPRAKGGDLGWPNGTSYVPEFQAALDKLAKGKMTAELVQSTYGWHIIEVTDTRPAKQQSLAEVKAQIQQIIVQKRKAEAYQKFLDELRKNAKIEILLEDLKAGAGSKASTTATGSK